jgi:hypothetical protein
MTKALILSLSCLAGFPFAGCSRASAETAAAAGPAVSASTLRKVTAAIEESKRTGVISRLDVKVHKVWVKPLVWAIWNAEAKEGFAVSAAIYCADQTSSDLQFADVIDSQSGKKLAHYGPLGFDVF